MTSSTIGVLLPSFDKFADNSPHDFVNNIREWGYEAVWAGELWGSDSLIQLGELASNHPNLRIGTSIVNVFSRTPATLAMAAATLNRISDGRFTLGVGVSTPRAIENVHGVDYDRPIQRTEEVIELVKTLTDDGSEERVEFSGDIFSVSGVPPLPYPASVYNAALGRKNRRVTGRVADGWIPHMLPLDTLGEAFEEVAEGARHAERDPDDIRVAPYVPIAVHDDPEQARGVVRSHIAYYVGSGEGYRNAVAEHFPDATERVSDAWNRGNRGEARDRVPDEMVDALGIGGRPEEARDRLKDLISGGVVDDPILVVPLHADNEIRTRTLEAVAPTRLRS